ncbi:MAG: hypothetical protein GEEBNDBF_02136 [bacterium]|nr:hypothetical protein [bacterium]
MSTPTHAVLGPATTIPAIVDRAQDATRHAHMGAAVLDFIATVSLEYGRFDARLFNAIVDWLGPVASELKVTAILVPNDVTDPGLPNHEVVVLDTGEEFYLFTTAWNANIGQPVIVCARPPFEGSGHHVLLHATETIFKVSLSTPGSPFLPEVPHWIRRAS